MILRLNYQSSQTLLHGINELCRCLKLRLGTIGWELYQLENRRPLLLAQNINIYLIKNILQGGDFNTLITKM